MFVTGIDIGTRNMAFCTLAASTGEILMWRKYDLLGNSKASKVSLATIVVRLIDLLFEELPCTSEAHRVIIEQQRGTKAVMVSVCHAIQAHFLTKARIQPSLDLTVHIQHSSHKLRTSLALPADRDETTDAPFAVVGKRLDGWWLNKQLGLVHARRYIERLKSKGFDDTPELKTDDADLADALLTAVYDIEKPVAIRRPRLVSSASDWFNLAENKIVLL